MHSCDCPFIFSFSIRIHWKVPNENKVGNEKSNGYLNFHKLTILLLEQGNLRLPRRRQPPHLGRNRGGSQGLS